MDKLEITEQQNTQYKSYLMRLWRSGPATEWHILLETVGSEEKKGFPNLEALFSFLRTLAKEEAAAAAKQAE